MGVRLLAKKNSNPLEHVAIEPNQSSNYPPAIWLSNPLTMKALVALGVPHKYMKADATQVLEMSIPEKAAVDAAGVAAASAIYDGNETMFIAAGTVILNPTDNELFIVDMSGVSNGSTLNLDLPLNYKGAIHIKRIDSKTTVNVNVRGQGGVLLDTAASVSLGVFPASMYLRKGAANWFRI